MNPYLFTLTFLLLMSFLTSSEAVRFSQSTLEHATYKNSQGNLVAAEELQALSQLEELRRANGEKVEPSDPKPPSPKNPSTKRIGRLRVNTSRPPNNSRLNLWKFVKDPHKKLCNEFSLYELFARVMRKLYEKEAFFLDYPQAEYRILDKILEKSEEVLNFTHVDQLSGLQLDDSGLQKVLYMMLKGTKEATSLLHFITFDPLKARVQARKINLLFAEPTLLEAIFQNSAIVDKILVKREQIWAEILYQEAHRLEKPMEAYKGRKMFGDDLQAALQEVLAPEDLNFERYKSDVFDCTLSEPGTVIFIPDALTGQVIREKYIPTQS